MNLSGFYTLNLYKYIYMFLLIYAYFNIHTTPTLCCFPSYPMFPCRHRFPRLFRDVTEDCMLPTPHSGTRGGGYVSTPSRCSVATGIGYGVTMESYLQDVTTRWRRSSTLHRLALEKADIGVDEIVEITQRLESLTGS